MEPLGGDRVVAATVAVVDVLEPLVAGGWDAPAGGLDWTCRRTAVHVASVLTKYAAQLAGRVDDAYLGFQVVPAPGTDPGELVRIIGACGRVLAAVVDHAPPDTRAWHWGPTDASGFAALGIGELLLHAHDIARGLGREWRPPGDLAEAVLTRLRPDVHAVGDPSILLLWSTGRADIPGRDHVDDWVWRAATQPL